MTINTTQDFFIKVQKNISTVIIYTLLFTLIAVGVTLVMPKEYVSTSTLLLKQNLDLAQDPYTLERSIDNRISTLENLLYTDSTYYILVENNALFKDEFNIDDIEKRRKAFKEDIKFQSEGGGFFSTLVYNKDPKKSLEMSNVLNMVMIKIVKENISQDLALQIVNASFTKRDVGRPNIVLNVFSGMLAGFFFGIIIVGLSDDSKNKKVEEYEFRDLTKVQSNLNE